MSLRRAGLWGWQWPELIMSAPESELRQIHARIIGQVFDLLRDGLSANHLAALGIECQRGLAMELPTAIERIRDPMAECGIVLPGQVAICFHAGLQVMTAPYGKAGGARSTLPPCDGGSARAHHPNTAFSPA